MFRFVLNAVTTLFVLGLFLALLIAFDWDFGAIFEWAWGITVWIIGVIAEWFASLPIFQEAVSR